MVIDGQLAQVCLPSHLFPELASPVENLSPEVDELRAEVHPLQSENHKFRQQAGYWRRRYRDNLNRINALERKGEPKPMVLRALMAARTLLERNRSAVGKTANSLVYPLRQQLTPHPCGGPARLDPCLNQGDPPCSVPPWPPGPRQGWAAGSDPFWLCELRVSQHFYTFYGSSVQVMDTQLNALPTLPVLVETVSGCVRSAFLGLF
jgi:hypothetical protein